MSKDAESKETDASGNPILRDIGLHLGRSFKSHFKSMNKQIDLKYIDPTYMIRAIPTIPSDRVYCNVLGQNSVHAAFAGFTGAPVCHLGGPMTACLFSDCRQPACNAACSWRT